MRIEKCEICFHKCGAERTEDGFFGGFCRLPCVPAVCRAKLHIYEEPTISGERGSGAIFFSGCIMRCEYCQNFEISRNYCGKKIDVGELCKIMERLCNEGAHNINFVSPTPYTPFICEALKIFKPDVPVIYNCTGYETPEGLKCLEGLVDIYLPDFKYADNSLGLKYSKTPNYREAAISAISEMYRQQKEVVHGNDGMMKSGVMIRHLVLPGCTENSKSVLDCIKENFSSNAFVSLMAQYTPNGQVKDRNLCRRVTADEYEDVCSYMLELGFENGFVQETDSAELAYVPEWDML